MATSAAISTSSQFRTRYNISAVKKFGNNFFWHNKLTKATDSEVIDFLKARVTTLEKELPGLKLLDAECMKFVLADCCAVLAEKCSTIGERAHYYAMAVDNLLHTNAFDFIAEQAEKAAFFFHLSGAESGTIRYNSIAAMALKSTAHQFQRNSPEAARALHKSFKCAQFAETLLWNRASRDEASGASAQAAGDLQAAVGFFLKASDDYAWIALLRARGAFMPLSLFDRPVPVYMLPQIPCADSAPSIAKSASLLFKAASLGEKPTEHLWQAFNRSCSAALALENGKGIVFASEKAFSLIYGIAIEQADAGTVAAFLSGICTELECRFLWEKAAFLSWHFAWLSAQNASREGFSPLTEQYLSGRSESLKRAKANFEKAGLQDEAKKIESILAGNPCECEKPPAAVAAQ